MYVELIKGTQQITQPPFRLKVCPQFGFQHRGRRVETPTHNALFEYLNLL